MKKKKIIWIICGIFILTVLALSLFHYFNKKTKFNDSYVNGNTAGNLYNGGLFCEYDGTVYFANPDDHFTLYSMPSEGGMAKKICNDTVTFLNVDEHYIYYAKNNKNTNEDFSFLRWDNNSLCRIKKNGKDRVVLDHDPSMYVSLLGNYLYYLHYDTDTATTLYRVKIDGSERQIADKQPYFTCSTEGKTMYYNGLEKDRYIYALNTETGNSNTLYKGDCWMPVVTGDTAYFLDVENNYCLTRLDLNTKETRALTKERVDCFNLYGSYIYYARNEEPALCRMKIDGSEDTEIMSGIFTDINVTSRFTYFRRLDEPNTIYCTPTNGVPSVTVFEPAKKK
ncbi:MAG: DUF5050 domain-containing protein [Lachnospiraceae bacterium]